MVLRLDRAVGDPLPYYVMMLDEIRRRADDFDVLHFHIDFLHYPLTRDFLDRTVTTQHGRLDSPELKRLYETFPEFPLVSISDAQREPIPSVNWAGTVYHGLPRDLFPFTGKPGGDYLAFLGRVSPEKGLDRAIAIASSAGMRLKVAAKIDKADRDYWDEVIGPMIATHPNVEYVGEIDEHQKAEFLGQAHALLFPIDWPEPFGLVMIEAMACGTPVIAFRRGAVPEIIDEGVSGFVVDDVGGAVAAVQRAEELDRAIVRSAFDHRFTVERMAEDYLAIYRDLADAGAQTTSSRRLRSDGIGLKLVASG
jgi:glycosyltransferase involved in cell wall biosynthesis